MDLCTPLIVVELGAIFMAFCTQPKLHSKGSVFHSKATMSSRVSISSSLTTLFSFETRLWANFQSISENFRTEVFCRAYKPGDFYEDGNDFFKPSLNCFYHEDFLLATDEDFLVLAAETTRYNEITVLEVNRRAAHELSGCRILLLDAPGNIHSVYNPYKVWTESYYDAFASIPVILPEGPIAIYGLAGGTAARILLSVWPNLELHGWEIDPEVVQVARNFFGVSEIEGNLDSSESGGLKIHIGDALAEGFLENRKFSGIIVDLYSDGVVIPDLQDSQTWENIKSRLHPNGRIMVNCGGGCVEPSEKNLVKKDGDQIMRETLAAISTSFPGKTWWRSVGDETDSNVLALTGDFPSTIEWRYGLPEAARTFTSNWKRYRPE